MVATLIISILGVILFGVLYLDARNKLAEKGDRALIDRQIVEAVRRGASPVSSRMNSPDDPDKWDLTPALVVDLVRYNGFVPEDEEGYISFRIQGESYVIRTDRLPYIWVGKSYEIALSDFDVSLLKETIREITDSIFLGKIVLYEEENPSLVFQVDAYEPKYGHFRDSFGRYLDIIHNMIGRFHQIYDEKKKQKDSLSQSTVGTTVSLSDIVQDTKKVLS